MSELVAAAEVTIDEINARGAEVSKLISSKAFIPALLKALEKPPLMTKDAKIKEANRDIVFKVVENITTDAQITEAVEAVAASSAFALDLLLKYVYLALATPKPPVPAGAEGAALEAALLEQKKWSGLLLKWHPIVVAKTGPGGVVRVMTERKTV